MKLSILIITYNHEKYISQAIESFLMQETNFDFEIIIGEDYSTDNTRKICSKYKEKYPNKIKLLLNKQNIGMMPNFVQTLKACKGKYIALCEGDDYWTDPLKLQKQVDFLEANEDFSICFHEAEVVDKNSSFLRFYNNFNINKEFDLYDLIKKNFITTASILLRYKRNLPDNFFKLSAGDWGLLIYYAQYGKIYYMKKSMSAYRVHPEGLWSKMTHNEMILKGVGVMKQLDKILDYKYHKEFKIAILNRLKNLQKEKRDNFLIKLKKKIRLRTRIKKILNE